ncbi:MAG: hypothetical protein AVO34_03840 [Firmicutes bacterium ML8_F2]|jgi:23S rRNA pseudouridine1911/1915/1917 synthase|nr:MAG: hypothetical protein AVO34_03840 [Firmicutes bacterium ML8_F2]
MSGADGSQTFFTVSAESEGVRLDRLLTLMIDNLSRNRAQRLIAEGMVHIDGEACREKKYCPRENSRVTVIIPPPEKMTVEPEAIRLDIVYEDEELLVVNKPRGMVVHPAPGHSRGTLVNALLAHCKDLSGIGGVMRPGIVHRLDKDTSGLLLVAKNDYSHRSLSTQLKARKVSREYIALVIGTVKPEKGRIDAPVGRHPVHRKKMAVVEGGRRAVTGYRVLKYYNGYTLLFLKLETGRTHQIRVHLAHIGYPVVGDPVYAPSKGRDLPPELDVPQALHARRISFIHPRSGLMMVFSVPLPPEFKKGLILLREQAGSS